MPADTALRETAPDGIPSSKPPRASRGTSSASTPRNYGEGTSNGETRSRRVRRRARSTRLGLEPQLFEPQPGRTERRRARRRAPTAPSPRCVAARAPRRRARPIADDWSVDPFAGVDPRRHAVGPRRRRHEEHGRHDPRPRSATSCGAGEQPARDLVLAFFADEENGGVYGSHWLVDNHPELFAGATEAISEVGGYSITVGGKRAYLLQTGREGAGLDQAHRARGTAAHGSR